MAMKTTLTRKARLVEYCIQIEPPVRTLGPLSATNDASECEKTEPQA